MLTLRTPELCLKKSTGPGAEPQLDPQILPKSHKIFVLYSVGENGTDEKGTGDDVVYAYEYKQMIHHFEDPDFNGNTYRKYRGRLTLNQEGKIRHP